MFSRKNKRELRQLESGNSVESQRDETPKHSTKGAYGLKKCHDSEEAVADIVFVHGLTGNRESTWTHKPEGIFWPAHLLKNDVSKTRILTFGYDADIVHFWAMASQNRVRNHATNLVNALVQLRERTETENRPILFVTHSLGGLVFEDAMLASRNSAEAHMQRVHDSTYGVCFLGTPHCGSTLANWAHILGQITNVVKKTDTSLLKTLQPESEVLALIQTDFHNMVRSRRDQGRPALQITCFYEELPVRGIGEIVPKHSAILPAYNAIGIHDDHTGMTKFLSDEDPGYLSVSTEILRWVREIQRSASNNKHDAALDQLNATAVPPESSFFSQWPANRDSYPSTPSQSPRYALTVQKLDRYETPDQTTLGSDSSSQGYRSMSRSPLPATQTQQAGNVITGSIINQDQGKVVSGNSFEGPVRF